MLVNANYLPCGKYLVASGLDPRACDYAKRIQEDDHMSPKRFPMTASPAEDGNRHALALGHDETPCQRALLDSPAWIPPCE